MQEEAEILDEIHALDSQVEKFPKNAHWFCAKSHDNDLIDYEHPDEPEEDASPEQKRKAVEEGKQRQDVAYKYAIVLGLDGEVTEGLYGKWKARVNHFLTNCSLCVYHWHEGRKGYLKYLTEQFNEEIAAALEERLDELDFKRIDQGLAQSGRTLAGVPPEERTQNLLADKDFAGLIALYEALCCPKYHQDDEKLAKHFDSVFEQIQARKVLRIADFPPAMTRFLFSRNTIRERFAESAWRKSKRNLTSEEFDWVVHESLEQAIFLVANPRAESEDILLFWKGFLSLLDRIDENVIRHCLRAMEVQPDVYRLALQHLASSSEQIVETVIDSLHSLLLKAPKDFWNAMGTISAATVVDQIFQSPGYAKLLSNREAWMPNPDGSDGSPVAWIPALLKSLDSVHQFEACRKLLDSLFENVQYSAQVSSVIKQACGQAAFEALHVTLQTLISPEYKINASTSLIVISNTMGLVRQFSTEIMNYADIKNNTNSDGAETAKAVAMLVIKDALALDCKAMGAEFAALENGKTLQRGGRNDSRLIWQAVLDIFRPGNLALVKSILPALVPLVGVDILRPEDRRNPDRLPKDHMAYNKDLRELFDNVSKVLERLSDFSSSDLSELMGDNAAARTLIACLISADEGVSLATVETIKVMTAQDNKRDAFEHLLSSDLAHTLTYMTGAIKKVSSYKTFGPVPHMVKTNRDVLNGLCGTRGVLRNRSTFQKEEQHAIFGWWTVIWHALDIAFANTEKWALRVEHPTALMQNFLRDFMDFAEQLFDNHSIIASVERDSNSSDTNTVLEKAGNKKVLDVVCRNINGLVNMLRLRDPWLVSTISSLLTKLLRSLGEYDLAVDDYASNFIKAALSHETHRNHKKTNLTPQQKASLQRALEENVGVQFVEIVKPTVVKKQGTIDAWSQSAEGRLNEPTLPPKRALPFTRTDKDAEKAKKLLEKEKSNEKFRELMKAKEAMSAEQRNQFMDKRKRDAAEAKRLRDEGIAKARALRGPTSIIKGEGSGIAGLGGVAGKDHAPTRSEIMVGSSDEDSDDDDDEDETDALVKKRKETSKIVSEYEENKRKNLKLAQQGPVKKTKIQRSAKDQRARVDPDMTKLYLEILNWDIFHPGDAPPGNNQCRKIDNKYQDLDLYKRTFGPLLISEVWRSIVTAKDENTYKPVEIKVLNRVNVDKFLEVSTTMPIAHNKDLKMSERDIVLFSKDSDPLNNPSAPHCLARVDRTTKKKGDLEITYRISRDVNPNMLTSFVPNGKIFALKICDLTTTQREFAALSSLEYYDLCTEVLEAKPSPLLKYPEEKVFNYSARYSLNPGQAKAILSANDNDGFTLIQGPPGSGKTKTIVAMVGALLTPILQQQKADQARVAPPTNGKTPAPTGPKKKLLICAPSNAAVDELVVRLMEGIQPLSGPRQKIKVIRIGRSDAINAAVKDVMLDELVRARLEGDDSEKQKIFAARDAVHKEAGQVKTRLAEVRPLMDKAQADAEIDTLMHLRKEFDQLKRRQAQLGAKIDEDKESGNTAVSRQNELNRRMIQQEIIDGAHVICGTLSGSGHDMFKNLNVDFETVIIDEAAQCIELSALIPLKYGCSKCILVGDPEQLPPTVLSRSAQSFGYEQSLFVRMQKNHPKNIHLLDTQYRMHPEISRFPSAQFYNSRLVDGQGMAALRQQPWHASKILGPYRFFDVKGVQTKQSQGHSFINIQELHAALQLYARLKTDYPGVDFKGKIGIITSYKAQLNELKARFASRYTDAIFEEIEFNTTDAFQGREREIIIFSCVRAKATGGIGFLGDIRRMNVGLTRAKSSLWVLGDSRALQQGKFWNELIEDAKERGRYTSENVMELFGRPTERLQGPVAPEAPLLPSLPNRTMSVSSASGDVVMTDASDHRKSSVSSAGGNVTIVQNAPKKNLLGISNAPKRTSAPHKHDSSRSSPMTGNEGTSSLGKRTRESSPDSVSSGPRGNGKDPKIDLDAMLRAQQANRVVPTARPAGVRPPKKKVAADPFIKRKPAPGPPPPKR